MKRLLPLAFVLAAGCFDGPDEPDTTVPVVEIPFAFQTGNDVSYVVDVFDEGGNVETVVGDCSTRHVDGTLNPNGTWSVEFINLPVGNHTCVITATDSAGWTGTAEDDVSI